VRGAITMALLGVADEYNCQSKPSKHIFLNVPTHNNWLDARRDGSLLN